MLATVSVSARGAGAHEGGSAIRILNLRRDGDLSQPLSVYYTVGGKAKADLDYHSIGVGITFKPGQHLRRIPLTVIDDTLQEPNEAVTLTLNEVGYAIDPLRPAATIRIISNDEPAEPQPTTITWTTRAASPIIRAEALRAVIDNKIYVFGGFMGNDGPVRRSDVYDPATNAWTRIADLPTRLTHAGVAVEGRDVYAAGGYVGFANQTGYGQDFGTVAVHRYNVDTNQWTTMPNLPRALASGGLVALGRKLHYFGGNDGARQDAGDHYVLDLDNTAAGWQTRASLPDPRSHLGYVGLAGKIYAIGGQHGNDELLTTVGSVHRYDPGTNQWTVLASMPVAISHIASAAFVLGNRIIVAGGETAHGAATSRVTAFDPNTNTWTSLTNLPAARFSGVAAAIGNDIYFTTGSSQTTTWKGVLS
jgi:N-acetylneuraminic acid mutarotase